MPIYKPSELKLFLHDLGIYPKKGLSQNFLIDGNIIRKIIRTSQVHKGDVVLEIGSGPGSLTQGLLEIGAYVVAVEKDNVLANALLRLQSADHRLEVHPDDILSFPFESIIKKHVNKGKRAHMIANLPYHLTTSILTLLSPMNSLFSTLTVMVQDEVARRMTALPGNKVYGSLTLFLQFYSQLQYAFLVSRHCFYPQPKVDSAIVSMQLREPPLEEKDIGPFFKVTRTAFEHRRKMLRSSLKELFSPEAVTHALTAIGKNTMSRPEELGLEDFLALYNRLT